MAPILPDLAEQISSAAGVVNHFLISNGHPQPSFDIDAPSSFPPAPSDVMDARQKLLEAAQTIVELMTGPAEHLRWLACRYHDMSSLRWIYHHKIAPAIPLDRAVPYADVAAATGVNEDHLKRMLRHAMTNRLFHEPEPGKVAHTAASGLLVHSGALNDWVGYTTEETYPASAKVVEAQEKFGASLSPTETAYNVAFDTDKPMFVHLAEFPERERRFANTMVEMVSTEGYGIHHLVDGYKWEDVDKATVVDVGGSTGHACIAIAEKAPEASFIVQDLAGVVAQGKASLPEALESRIRFQEHDFFTRQPESADIYLLRFILHDHPDPIAVKIIQSLIPAMQNGSRLLINDGVYPEPNTLSRGEEKIARIMDLEMLTTFNARERPLADWVQLCASADSRLTLRSVSKPNGSVMSILEFVFEY
ncbi:S-adenosyl-L-methionine-dependent methyltransferase [Aspergillus cavernicola]|uniref:S-adenosyl-L-methionine-dependent methyltransferase n=1 Tax=Aspergillus cavernicola TaxID=176166 RepID=A0ABR4I990_9EURO